MITRTSGKLLYKYIFYIMTSQLCTYILGKVSKLKSQGQKGEDTFGNQYKSIDEMWKRELKPDQAELQCEGMDIKGRVGDEQAWYKKQIQYWDVRHAS